MAPPIACPINVARAGGTGGVVSSGGGSSSSAGGGAANTNSGSSRSAGNAGMWISAPAAGAQLNGSVPILGTANVAGMQYYKLEIGSGTNPRSWTTFGTTHSPAVSNGHLETLQAGSLPAGDYVIRLVVVMEDGNFSTPHAIPVTIAP